MIKKILVVVGVLFSIIVAAQEEITFNKHIAPIIYKRCATCHNPNGYAPFSLVKYKDVKKRANFVKHVTQTGYMPPWKANPGYRSFANEKLMTDEEVELIKRWAESGAKEGKKKDLPPTPSFTNGSQLKQEPDYSLTMQTEYTVEGNNEQTYICYKIPYELPEEKYVKAIEFVPGNRLLVHHASYQVLEVAPEIDIYNSPDYFVYGDSDYVDDKHDYGFFNLYDKYGNPPIETYHNGWLPGTSAHVYPDGIGFRMPKKGIFMIRNLHYAPSPIEQSDQSTVNFYFTDKPVERVVQFAAFKPTYINPNEENIIPADSIVKHHIYVKINSDISLLNINPHMHQLGKYFKVFVTTPTNDTIPLVEIPEWDFDWQEFYQFKKMVKIPKGSVLHAEALFDNTANNPKNPHNPPQDVYFERGMDDEDEMMRLVLLVLPYQAGDEEKGVTEFWSEH